MEITGASFAKLDKFALKAHYSIKDENVQQLIIGLIEANTPVANIKKS